MQSKIFISVLVANFNNASFLESCIKSIINQSYPEHYYEILICDDASTDDSIRVLKELEIVHKFLFLSNLKNMGVGATKQRLIEASNGDWFIFVDSDDKLKLNCLQELNDYINLLQNIDISIVYANSMRLSENGKIEHWKRSKPYSGSLIENKFIYPIFHPIIYRRIKYDLTDGIDVNLKSAEDYDLWYKMEEVGEIHFLDLPLYYYRLNLNGLSQAGYDLNKWVQVMLDHSFCTANAAKRRGLNMKNEINEFAEVILGRISNSNQPSTLEFIKTKVRKIKQYFTQNG